MPTRQHGRTERTLIGDERTQLDAFLDDSRDELIASVEGLPTSSPGAG